MKAREGQAAAAEVEQRLREFDEVNQPADGQSVNQVIAAYMAGARDSETCEPACRIFAEHKDFFDMIGDR